MTVQNIGKRGIQNWLILKTEAPDYMHQGREEIVVVSLAANCHRAADSESVV
jgi:hypothetical protein